MQVNKSQSYHVHLGTNSNLPNRSQKVLVINLSRSLATLAYFGNTSVCRKSSTAQKALADVTLESSEKLVQSLKEMNDLNKLIEEKKVDVEKQMFIESMQNKGEIDIQVLENARMTLFNQ